MRRLFLLFIFVVACVPERSVRQGDVGEICNGSDSDCRPGLVCSQGYCGLFDDVLFDCDAVCDRFDRCGAPEEGCVVACRITTEAWTSAAKNSFGRCIVEQLSCDSIQQRFAPQTCYEQLPLDSNRQALCDSLGARLAACGLSDPDESARAACYQSARTERAQEWQKSEACAQLASENSSCDEIEVCLNTVL